MNENSAPPNGPLAPIQVRSVLGRLVHRRKPGLAPVSAPPAFLQWLNTMVAHPVERTLGASFRLASAYGFTTLPSSVFSAKAANAIGSTVDDGGSAGGYPARNSIRRAVAAGIDFE